MQELLSVIPDVLHPYTVAALLIGLVFGYVVGVLPGLNRVTALAICLPFTYLMSPLAALALLVGVSKGGAAGGAITSILLNTPGEPSSAATCLDGYPLTRQGKAGKALAMALYAAVFGDLFATVTLILVAAPLSRVALKMGPIEVCAVLVFSLTFIAALSGESLTKGLIAGALGIFFASVGMDSETAAPRLTFGFTELMDGMPLLAVGVGMLALSEMMVQMEQTVRGEDLRPLEDAGPKEDRTVSREELRGSLRTLFRSSVVGVVVGILPGLGATIASFMGYSLAKRAAKNPARFGQGEVEGVAAAEAADNAVTAAALIPLFALGIPGSVAAAVLIGAFTAHGVTPGPLMFQNNARLIYGIYGMMILASLLILPIGRLGLRAFSHVARIRESLLCPAVVFLCFVGAFTEGNGMFAVWLCIGFGVLGYVMKKVDLSFVTFLIGFILGPMFELSLRQTIILTGGSWGVLLKHPIALVFLAFTVVMGARLSRAKASGRLGRAPRAVLAEET
ncbi:MAG: tripartite tricarboxylate transporter permease [Deltaproteobacteria bacterium]|nr:tripartite tricarboxylate transporter permease [Deltaproteobacteria bacterium]